MERESWCAQIVLDKRWLDALLVLLKSLQTVVLFLHHNFISQCNSQKQISFCIRMKNVKHHQNIQFLSRIKPSTSSNKFPVAFPQLE